MSRSVFFILAALVILALFYFEPAFYTGIIFPLSGTFRDFLWDFRTFVPIALGIICLLIFKPLTKITGGLVSGIFCIVVIFLVLCDIAAPQFALNIKIWMAEFLGGSALEEELRRRLNSLPEL